MAQRPHGQESRNRRPPHLVALLRYNLMRIGLQGLSGSALSGVLTSVTPLSCPGGWPRCPGDRASESSGSATLNSRPGYSPFSWPRIPRRRRDLCHRADQYTWRYQHDDGAPGDFFTGDVDVLHGRRAHRRHRPVPRVRSGPDVRVTGAVRPRILAAVQLPPCSPRSSPSHNASARYAFAFGRVIPDGTPHVGDHPAGPSRTRSSSSCSRPPTPRTAPPRLFPVIMAFTWLTHITALDRDTSQPWGNDLRGPRLGRSRGREAV